VVNKINAVDPGNLVASLSTVGNGNSLLDNSGLGPLTVDSNALGTALGLAGTEPGTICVPLVGKDVNPRPPAEFSTFLVRLQNALQNNDNVALTRLNGEIDTEGSRLSSVRGQIGARCRLCKASDSSLKIRIYRRSSRYRMRGTPTWPRSSASWSPSRPPLKPPCAPPPDDAAYARAFSVGWACPPVCTITLAQHRGLRPPHQKRSRPRWWDSPPYWIQFFG